MKRFFTFFLVVFFAANMVAQCPDPLNPDCHVMKVEMLYFNGQSINGGTQLNWATASEENSSHFLLEKSTDAATWMTLATIKTFNKPSNYSFDDASNVSAYYRLSEVGTDGKVEIFKAIFVERFASKLEVFPNPTATKSVTISSSQVVEIFNLAGKKVGSVRNGSTTFSDLTTGVYVVKSGSEVKRLIVQ